MDRHGWHHRVGVDCLLTTVMEYCGSYAELSTNRTPNGPATEPSHDSSDHLNGPGASYTFLKIPDPVSCKTIRPQCGLTVCNVLLT